MEGTPAPREPRLSRQQIHEVHRPPGGRFPRGPGFWSIGIIVIALVGVCALAAWSFAQKKNVVDLVAGMFVPPPQQYFNKDRIRVLAVGLDYDYDLKDQETSKDSRTDTIITASLNFPTATVPKASIGVVSVPRDMLVTYPNGKQDKINGAYSTGGIKNSESVVADFLGLPGFDRYVVLRVDSTKALIDAIGGIDVVPDKTMDYDDHWGHLSIHFTGGRKYHMNGEQAVSYARFRHDWCGDPCRIKRQQQVIRITIAKLKNDKFNDLIHIRELSDVFKKNVDTNFSNPELLSIAHAFSTLDLADVSMTQVPYVGDEDLACCGNVILPDFAERAAIVKSAFLDPIAPPVDPKLVAAIPPGKVRVEVENGSGIGGLATRMAAGLKKQGFVVVDIGNADSNSHSITEIQTHSPSVPLAGQRVKSALGLGGAKVSPNPETPPQSASSDVTIVVGRDYETAILEATAASPK
jgi:LCP family protein required for cell wall assembly